MSTVKEAVKQAIGILLSGLVLTCSGWWYFSKNDLVHPLDDAVLEATVDTRISGLTVQQFNEQGVLINQLKTPLMQHIPKGDVHLIQSPYVIITQEHQAPWEIHSLKAQSFEGGQRITFMQQVVIHQNTEGSAQGSTLKTEEVTYYPQQKKATTNLFVTFEQPGHLVQSTGMNAYLDEKRVELLHRAKGRYEPSAQG